MSAQNKTQKQQHMPWNVLEKPCGTPIEPLSSTGCPLMCGLRRAFARHGDWRSDSPFIAAAIELWPYKPAPHKCERVN